MQREKKIQISASSEIVFRHLVEPDLLMSWNILMKEFKYTSEITNGDLQDARFRFKFYGNILTGRVIEYNPFSSYIVYYKLKDSESTVEYLLSESDGITTLTVTVPVKNNGLYWKMIGAVISIYSWIKRDSRLVQLKASAEAFASRS